MTISIHAPSRERHRLCQVFFCLADFNPRSLTGATLPAANLAFGVANFNPRSLTGATLPPDSSLVEVVHFNPRSLTGATFKTNGRIYSVSFQSTLPHGSDNPYTGEVDTNKYFNPRSLTGATAFWLSYEV